MSRIALVLAALTSVAHADPPAIRGAFGFDTLKPQASKCAEVKGGLLTKLTKDYACTAPDSESASGVAVVAMCKAKRGKSQFMLMRSAADCRNERETQLANGE